MPLARILTRFPEQAGALSQELRQHGYTVEFSNPELAGKPPADLEIDFEICAEPDALSRAAELADQLHADVAISPGVLQEHEETLEAQPSIPAERLPELVEPPIAFESPTACGKEPASKPAEEPVWEPEPLPELAESVAPAETMHQNVVPIRSHSLEPLYAPQKSAVDDEFDLMKAATPEALAEDALQEEEVQGETATELLARMGEKSATLLHAASAAGRQTWRTAGAWAHDFWLSARRLGQEGRERVNVRTQEWKVQHQQKLLDQEKRRVLAQERAAELEAAREAAAMRLQELLRERGGLTEAQPAPPQKIVTATPAALPATAVPRRLWLRMLGPISTGAHGPQMQAVIMGVAAACLLFVVGLAVSSFHGRPAISNTLEQPKAAQPSYKGVTVQNGGATGVTVQGGGVTVHAGTPAAATTSAVRPSPAVQAEAQNPAPAQHSRTSDVTIRNFPAARKPSPVHTGNSEHIGDDVTIRHFSAQVNEPAHSAPRADLKHYSDLDN